MYIPVQCLDAYNVLLQPTNQLKFNNASINAANELGIFSGDLTNYGLEFIAEAGTVEAKSLDSDFLVQNGAMTINAEGYVNIGNLNYVFIDGAPLNPTDLTITTQNNAIQITGENTISGDMTLTVVNSGEIHFYNNSVTTIGGNLLVNNPNNMSIIRDNAELYANNIEINGNSLSFADDSYIEATNDITLTSYYLSLGETTVVAGNDINLAPTGRLYIDGSSITAGNALNISSGDITTQGTYILSGQ